MRLGDGGSCGSRRSGAILMGGGILEWRSGVVTIWFHSASRGWIFGDSIFVVMIKNTNYSRIEAKIEQKGIY